MTRDSCSYIVSAVPLPFIKQSPSPPHNGISVLSLFYLNAGLSFSISYCSSLSFPCFTASSKVLLSFALSSALTSLLFIQPWMLGRAQRGHVGGPEAPGQCDSRLPVSKITLLPKYPASNTKKGEADDERIFAKASTRTENPPKALQTLFSHAL